MNRAVPYPATDLNNGNADPFRQPHWRWLAAMKYAGRRRLRSFNDPAIGEAARFQRAWNAAETSRTKSRVISRWPQLAAAFEIFQTGNVSRDEIEARVLAGETSDRIASKTSVAAPVIEQFKTYFFDVAGALHAVDWLICNVLRVSTWRLPVPTEGEGWKWLAIAAGPYMLDMVIADHLGRTEPAYPDRSLLAKKARFCVRDYASGMSAEGHRFFAEEGFEVFREELDAALQTDRRPVLQAQMELLRLTSKLPTMRKQRSSEKTIQVRPMTAAPSSV